MEDGLAKYVTTTLFAVRLTAADQHRSIGVSNFGVKDLEILLASAKIKPAANQVSEDVMKFSREALTFNKDSSSSLCLHATGTYSEVCR